MAININLLPWREERNEQKKQQFFLLLALCGSVSALFIFGLHILLAYQLSYQDGLNDVLRAQIAELDQKIVEITNLQKEKEDLLDRMEIIQQLQTDRQKIVRLFDNVARAVPDGLYLTSLNRTGNQLLIEGKAESNTRVSKFMRNIEASDWLSNPVLSLIQADVQENHGLGFSLQAIQNQDKSGMLEQSEKTNKPENVKSKT